MDNYEIEMRVKAWISDSERFGQHIEVQIRNTDTDKVVHTTMNPLFVLGVCRFTNVSNE